MLPRTLEPEVMDTAAEAADYNSMDHGEVNRRFVDDLLARAAAAERNGSRPIRVLDLGTGTALIPIELCRRPLRVEVTAIDLAAEMLRVAEQNVLAAGLQSAIKLELVDAKTLPAADGAFDWVISNSIIHHIPEPLSVFRQMRRILRPGGLLFVRDLLRPADAATVGQLVATYAAGANAHQRQMFEASLHAALTLDELRQLLAQAAIPPEWAQQTTDRHWTVAGRLSAGG
jgi:ubiquinone/menaquinone biosynthesis C-methylase UbiE